MIATVSHLDDLHSSMVTDMAPNYLHLYLLPTSIPVLPRLLHHDEQSAASCVRMRAFLIPSLLLHGGSGA